MTGTKMGGSGASSSLTACSDLRSDTALLRQLAKRSLVFRNVRQDGQAAEERALGRCSFAVSCVGRRILQTLDKIVLLEELFVRVFEGGQPDWILSKA